MFSLHLFSPIFPICRIAHEIHCYKSIEGFYGYLSQVKIGKDKDKFKYRWKQDFVLYINIKVTPQRDNAHLFFAELYQSTEKVLRTLPPRPVIICPSVSIFDADKTWSQNVRNMNYTFQEHGNSPPQACFFEINWKWMCLRSQCCGLSWHKLI